jgi:hypothetical protein
VPDFKPVRQFLETHLEQLAAGAADPAQFRREFANLQRYWEQEDDEALKWEEAERVLRKYPAAWQAMLDAGLVPGAEKAAPAPPASPPAPPPPPQPAAAQPQGETTMEERQVSQSTLNRMAIWDKQLATGKEVVTGCLGVLIVLVTLLVALIAIVFAGNADARSAAKDVLLVLTGLVGVVLGYYFGRVPGEVRADKAESEAKVTRSALDRTVTEVRGLLEDRGVDVERGGAGEVTLTPAQVERLRDLVRRSGQS